MSRQLCLSARSHSFYCLATAYYLTDIYRKEEKLQLSSFVGAILGLFAFLMTIIQVDISDSGAQLLQTTGETAIIYNGVALGSWVTRFSGVGIFIGILTAVLATQVYRFCVKKEKSRSKCQREYQMGSVKHLLP